MKTKRVHSTAPGRMTPIKLAKKTAKRLLRQLGYAVSRVEGDRPTIENWTNWTRCLELFKKQGFQPKTIFDIGVAAGTPELYAAFPNAVYYLIDPTHEALPHMQVIARGLNATILNLALGDEECSVEIEVRPNDIGASSLFEEVGPLADTKRYLVPVRRFDQEVGTFEGPALCKIDVQGAEMGVLNGMGARIHEFDAFLIEISTIATIKNGPEADKVLAFLGERGFVIYDILSLNRRPLDSALAQLDILFVKRNSPLRLDHRWRATAS